MFDALLRRQSFQILNRFTSVIQKLSRNDSSLVPSQPIIKSLIEDDRFRKTSEFKEKFVENLFLSKFQEDILEYPEIDTIQEVNSLNLHCDFAKKLLTGAVDAEDNKKTVNTLQSEKAVTKIKKFELSGFRLPRIKRGYGYLESEYTFMHEALSLDLSLSKAISENEDYGIQLINLFGNALQKEIYLPKLASGENIACFAHLESGPLVSLDPISVNTNAVLTSDGESYVVSGKKNWVYNAKHADVIIFSANIKSSSDEKSKSTLFLIDKNLEGIKVHEPIETIGLKGLDICEITFNEAVVPSSSVLGNIDEGNEIIKKILTRGKINNGAQCITVMKKLVNLAINHCIHNKFFKKNKYEREYFQSIIGKIVSRLYSVESMTYLITGRMDSFDNADVFLESLMIKIHASESLQYILQATIEILGTKAFEEEYSLEQIMKDSQFFSICDDTNDYLRLVLSSLGLRHVIKYKTEANPLTKLKNSLSKQNMRKYVLQLGDENYLNFTHILHGYLHLMFQGQSVLLEDAVYNLKETTRYLLNKYKEDIYDRHYELKMLANMLINVYAITAIAGRASRAYCLAVKFDEVDQRVAEAEVNRLHFQFTKIQQQLKKCDFNCLEKVKSTIMSTKSYAENYPILRSLSVPNR